MIKFILITNQPDLARAAEASGVNRIMVDLEILGKQERQGHLDTLISRHSFSDIARVRRELKSADLIVRLNPWHADSHLEIDRAIDQGADTLMLPMFHRSADVSAFCESVDGRVGVMPLVETSAALGSVQDLVEMPGVSEIYIGLNDLHLDMGLSFMFEPLANGLIDNAAAIVTESGLPFGFGGIARIGEGIVPGEMVLAEHARLGSSSVILSRAFSKNLLIENMDELRLEVDKLKQEYRRLKSRPAAQIESDRARFCQAVKRFVASRKR